jgi:phage shock protein PspC (stress-responsive transcriptional regulator)
MFCTFCGRGLEMGDRFCAQCGKANSADATTPPFPQAQRARSRFLRSMSDKKIAGVCSGLARYLDLDVTLIRIVFLAGILLHGATLIAYIICWIAMGRDNDYIARSAPAVPQT